MIQATGAQVIARGASASVATISIDSRTITPGDWFVAIQGPHFDGHHFCAAVIAKGAAGLMVDHDPLPLRPTSHVSRSTSFWCLRVPDTVAALGAIARRWRQAFAAVPCVAITGSNGKSTTKEMVAAVVAARGPVLKTEGNFNNLIGLPLTVLRWTEAHRTAVLEMGMSAAGEIAQLTAMVAPDVGVITNATAAHLEQLHTVENVAAAKGELFAAMRRDGVVCINREDALVRALGMAYPGRKVTFGMQNGCDVQFGRMAVEGLDTVDLTVYIRGTEKKLRLHVPGTHNVMNALAAIAVGCALDIPVDEICARLPAFHPMQMRMERVQLANGVQVVNDAYNANPQSMEVALRTVGVVRRAGQFIAVLGDMLGLGPQAETAHRQLGAQAQACGVQRLFVTGQQARHVADGAVAAGCTAQCVEVVAEMPALQRAVAQAVRSGDVVLVKGSRGMQMERVVEYLKQEYGTG